jgi:hypothetical protein
MNVHVTHDLLNASFEFKQHPGIEFPEPSMCRFPDSSNERSSHLSANTEQYANKKLGEQRPMNYQLKIY